MLSWIHSESSWQAPNATGSVVQYVCHPAMKKNKKPFHWTRKQGYLAPYVPTLLRGSFQCSDSNASVGGMFSIDLEPFASRCFLASFIVSSQHVLLSRNTVNLWMVCSSGKWSWAGNAAKFRKDSVSGSNTFHMSQYVFFPCPVSVTPSQDESVTPSQAMA